MTKRILAIVLAMVMCLSVLSVEIFASNITAMNDVKATYSGTSITVSWGTVSGAAKYDVEILKNGTRVNSSTVTGTSTTLNVYNAGSFDINVYAKDSNGKAVGTGSTTCTIPQQSTQSGITVSSTANGVSVSWSAVAGVSSYYVGYTYYDASNKSQSTYTTTDKTSVELNVAYDKLSSVSVRVGNSSGYSVGSWNKSYNPGGSTGNVTYSNGYLRWTNSYNTYYTVSITINGSNAGSYNAGYTNSYNVASIINQYANSTIVFTVYASSYGSIGSYTYYPQQQSYGGLYVYGTVVSWQAVGTQDYTVTASTNGRILLNQNVGRATSIDLSNYIYASDLRNYSISITVVGSSTGTIGSTIYNYNNNNNNYQQGNVYISGTYVNWTGVGSQSYTVTATANGKTIFSQSVGNTTSINLANYISDYDLRNYAISITVTGSATGYIGSATYYYNNMGNTGVGVGGLKVEIQGSFANISWDNISGAVSYKAIYTIGGSQYQYEVYQNSVRLDYTRGLQVTIQYKMGNNYYNIGTASVSANGVVNNSSNIVNNPVVNGNTINGVNCTLTIGTTSSTLTWQRYSGAVRYDVIYANSSTGVSYMIQNITANTTTIPLGSSNSKGFTCQVIPYGTNQILTNGPFATVTYSGGVVNPGTNNNKSEIKNLVLTEVSGGTTVSWTPVTGVSYYQIDYYRTDTGYSSLQNVTTKNEYSLPFSKNIGFEVYVYAYVGNRLQTVGSAVHVAGDSYTKTEDNKPADEPTLSAYVTNFKGVATDKKVVLSWNAASGNPTYKVYWKRSTSSEWKLAKNTTKRALTISGLNTNVSYDFKVVANGKDSGIVTVTTPKTGSTTVTAKDPAGAGTVTTTVPEIVSVQSKNGTLEVTWSKVKNATNYKVYIADQNSAHPSRYSPVPSTTYWPGVKVDISGTTAKITGMKAGTYKIRLKASTDNGKTWTDLADCDYRTVTVN